MWIPTSIYERLPQFWLLLGLLFMASGVFLGFEYWLSFVYITVGFGFGFGCCCWSAWTLSMRLRNRRPAIEQVQNAAPAEERQREQPLPNV